MKRPYVCLAMIVKNEMEHVGRVLRSAYPYVDAVAVDDTGSTDGTAEWLEGHLRRPASFKRTPWTDYATNRNAVLSRARGMADYVLLMDASDVLEVSPEVRSLVTVLSRAPAFQVQHVMGDLAWYRPALIRSDVPWHYVGRVHETLVRGPSENLVDCPVLEGVRIHCNVGGGYKGAEYFLEQARLLHLELHDKPDDPRSVFYLAQAFQCAGENELAAKWYDKRTKLAGWPEERTVSWLRLGEIIQDPGCFMEAEAMNPSRAEAAFHLAMWWKSKGRMDQALLWAHEAAERTSPEGLFVDTSVHRYKAKALLAELTNDRALAREVLNIPGATYSRRVLELAATA